MLQADRFSPRRLSFRGLDDGEKVTVIGDRRCAPEESAPAFNACPAGFESQLSSSLPLLTRWVFSRTPAGVDAEDVIQQTLLLALRHAGTFRFEASVGTWLCTIALNELRSRGRNPSRLVYEERETLERLAPVDTSCSPLAALERRETYLRLHRAVLKLPTIYRVVVELRDFGGLSTRETARRLAISISSVKSRHLRARRQLSILLNTKMQAA